MPVEETLSAELTAAVDTAVETLKPAEEKEENGNSTDQNNPDESGSVGDGGAADDSGGQGDGGAEKAGTDSGSGAGDDASVRQVPQKPVLSDRAVTEAIRAGFTLEEAKSFADEKMLIRTIELVRQQSVKPAEKIDILANFPKLDPEAFEPEVIKSFDSLREIIQKQQEKIEAFDQYTQRATIDQQRAHDNEVESWFDKQVSALGDEYKELLGTGGYSSLDKSTPQFAKRQAIADQAAVLLAGYNASGRQAPSRDEVFQSAAKLVLMDDMQKIKENKLSSSLEKRATQHIARAGGAKGKVSQDPAEAVAAMLDESFFKK